MIRPWRALISAPISAIQATGGLMNFAILSNYLGQPCNPDRAMKVCVEFYDDPALAGINFGPDLGHSSNRRLDEFCHSKQLPGPAVQPRPRNEGLCGVLR